MLIYYYFNIIKLKTNDIFFIIKTFIFKVFKCNYIEAFL